MSLTFLVQNDEFSHTALAVLRNFNSVLHLFKFFFYHERMLYFINCFFVPVEKSHVSFSLHIVNVVTHCHTAAINPPWAG